jgi:hypothetical protein
MQDVLPHLKNNKIFSQTEVEKKVELVPPLAVGISASNKASVIH